MTLLPDNPTQFDYLHAIRAAASRGGSLSRIYQLADEGMNTPQPKPKHNPNWVYNKWEDLYETVKTHKCPCGSKFPDAVFDELLLFAKYKSKLISTKE